MQNQTLYEKIESFEFPANFHKRLCRENSWSPAQGRAVIDEYRRFLYLAMVSPQPVTPSEAVDQAWHLHLIHTRSYWEDLCQNTLPRPLHHGPTAGGKQEDEKFENWYERTKAFYASELNQPPPPSIWPASEVRFNPNQRLRWLDTTRHWIIPKPNWQAALPSVLPFLLLSSAAPVVLVMVIVTAFFLLVGLIKAATKSQQTQKNKGDGGSSVGGCSGSSDSSSDSGDSGGSDSGCGGGGCGGGCGGGD